MVFSLGHPKNLYYVPSMLECTLEFCENLCFLGGSWRIPNLDRLRSSPTESQRVSRVELWIHGCIAGMEATLQVHPTINGGTLAVGFFLSILDSRIQNIIHVKQPHHVMHLLFRWKRISIVRDATRPKRRHWAMGFRDQPF